MPTYWPLLKEKVTVKQSTELTHKLLLEIVHYEPCTGVFTWLQTRSNNAKAGGVAGSLNKCTGYSEISIFKKAYYAHRLAWFYIHGEWPTKHIDHIDGNRANNASTNLRDVPAAHNIQNQHKLPAHNTSGVRGICWRARIKRWIVQISIANRTTYIGCFETLDSAKVARAEAVKKHHAGATLGVC